MALAEPVLERADELTLVVKTRSQSRIRLPAPSDIVMPMEPVTLGFNLGDRTMTLN